MNKPIRREFLRKLIKTQFLRIYTKKYLYMAICIKHYELYEIYRIPIKHNNNGTYTAIGKDEYLGIWEYK